MGTLLEVEYGTGTPWEPSPFARLVEVYQQADIPLAGTFQIHNHAEFGFLLVAGAREHRSFWALFPCMNGWYHYFEDSLLDKIDWLDSLEDAQLLVADDEIGPIYSQEVKPGLVRHQLSELIEQYGRKEDYEDLLRDVGMSASL